MTIGRWGCADTAGCIAAQAFGVDMTPDQVASHDEVFIKDGTMQGSLLWKPFARALGVDFGFRLDTTENRSASHSVFDHDAVRRHMDTLVDFGIPSLALVDTNDDHWPNHWVTYVGNNQAIDPWDGMLKSMKVFGPVYGLAILNGTPVLAGGKLGALVGKANEIANGRNVMSNSQEIMDVINRP